MEIEKKMRLLTAKEDKKHNLPESQSLSPPPSGEGQSLGKTELEKGQEFSSLAGIFVKVEKKRGGPLHETDTAPHGLGSGEGAHFWLQLVFQG